jgi:hypothetical protein
VALKRLVALKVLLACAGLILPDQLVVGHFRQPACSRNLVALAPSYSAAPWLLSLGPGSRRASSKSSSFCRTTPRATPSSSPRWPTSASGADPGRRGGRRWKWREKKRGGRRRRRRLPGRATALGLPLDVPFIAADAVDQASIAARFLP